MSTLDSVTDIDRLAGPAATVAGNAGRRGGHGRIADIELLRAAAVLFTIFEHAHSDLITWHNRALEAVFSYFRFGSGVDLFFAISGFVIARTLVPSLGRCRDTMDFARVTLAFWVRRAWRLLPSAWLWLMIILVASVAFNRFGTFGSFHANFEATIAGLLDVANFRFMTAFGHFYYGASFPYWSLSLEEQFYLLFPVVIFVARRWLPAVLGVGIVLQLFTPRTALLSVIRTDAMMLGILIALWSRHPSYRLFEPAFLCRSALARGVMLVLPLGMIAALTVPGTAIVPFPVGVVALLSAGLVLVASYDGDYLMRAGPVKQGLLWIGARSYSLYVIHVPAMYAMRELWQRLGIAPAPGRGVLLVLSTAALTLLLAQLNFMLVERPLRARGARIAAAIRGQAPDAAPGAAAAAAVPK